MRSAHEELGFQIGTNLSKHRAGAIFASLIIVVACVFSLRACDSSQEEPSHPPSQPTSSTTANHPSQQSGSVSQPSLQPDSGSSVPAEGPHGACGADVFSSGGTALRLPKCIASHDDGSLSDVRLAGECSEEMAAWIEACEKCGGGDEHTCIDKAAWVIQSAREAKREGLDLSKGTY